MLRYRLLYELENSFGQKFRKSEIPQFKKKLLREDRKIRYIIHPISV